MSNKEYYQSYFPRKGSDPEFNCEETCEIKPRHQRQMRLELLKNKREMDMMLPKEITKPSPYFLLIIEKMIEATRERKDRHKMNKELLKLFGKR